MNQLDCLEGLRLEDLVLDGNPLCSKYKDHSTYVSDVKKFPKVLKLDGVDLSTPILADVNEDLQIPTIKGNYSRSEGGLSFVQRFLGEYYQLYDSDNTEKLVNCYLENSMFSLKSTYPLVQSYTGSELVKYIPDSQNTLCGNNDSDRYKLLSEETRTLFPVFTHYQGHGMLAIHLLLTSLSSHHN
jgi:nuclear RNA export factor